MGGQSGKKKIFCDDGHDQGAPSCNTFQGQTPGQALGDLRGKNVHVEWKVQYNPPNSNAKVRYIGLVSSSGNSREFYVDDPMGSNAFNTWSELWKSTENI